MSEVKQFHLREGTLVEGKSLGFLNVYLAADYDQLNAASREMAQTIIMLRADKDALVEALEDAIDYLNEPLNSIQHGSILYSQMCEALAAYRAAMGSKGE